ncbi:hypothetical protein [Flavobacterium sp. SM2513]|uniref:hypothetical protein n=1 Tax=Flavobacterium sp. SM2513 TaxID=3424766 RepID=UPI003D7F5E19
MNSNFDKDLTNEAFLAKYLDGIYPTLFNGFAIERISDLKQQQQGIDLVLSKEGTVYTIDEKAQLDYLESDLPTFAFEISYLKYGQERLGWLYDSKKITDFYFTITAIKCNEYNVPESGFRSCKIFSVDRRKLINLLNSRGLNIDRIKALNEHIRKGTAEDRIKVDELNAATEGKFFYSKKGKAEQPINIVLKLDFLIKSKVAKRIY